MAASFVNGSTGYDRMGEMKKFDETKMGVKGLSDAGITTIPEFFVQPPETLADLKNSALFCSDVNIPVIDLSGFNSPTQRPELIREVSDAAKTWGFFQVINHGIPMSVIDETIAATKAFHSQPLEVKSRYYSREDEHRGVMYTSNNDLFRAKAAQWIDSLQIWMGPEPPVVEDIPEVFRKEAIRWDAHATKVAENVMELLSQGLGLEAGTFKELTFSEKRALLAHCYPPCPQPDLTVGIRSHTDPPIMTVLLPNHVPGLQVKHHDAWVQVKPLPGALIINVGDLLQVNKLNSLIHFVVSISSSLLLLIT